MAYQWRVESYCKRLALIFTVLSRVQLNILIYTLAEFNSESVKSSLVSLEPICCRRILFDLSSTSFTATDSDFPNSTIDCDLLTSLGKSKLLLFLKKVSCGEWLSLSGRALKSDKELFVGLLVFIGRISFSSAINVLLCTGLLFSLVLFLSWFFPNSEKAIAASPALVEAMKVVSRRGRFSSAKWPVWSVLGLLFFASLETALQ